MKTDNKEVTSPEYWDRVYSGNNMNALEDSSNTKTVKTTFDRFTPVVKLAEGPNVLGIGSGHARHEKMIKALHPDWNVIASDMSEEAKKVANYKPYDIFSAYDIPYLGLVFDTIICTQVFNLIEFPDKFMLECKRVSKVFLCTIPNGETRGWSQVHVYTQENTRLFFEQYGEIEVLDFYEYMILIKLRFDD